jgi:hypothetical protein
MQKAETNITVYLIGMGYENLKCYTCCRVQYRRLGNKATEASGLESLCFQSGLAEDASLLG